MPIKGKTRIDVRSRIGMYLKCLAYILLDCEVQTETRCEEAGPGHGRVSQPEMPCNLGSRNSTQTAKFGTLENLWTRTPSIGSAALFHASQARRSNG
jgi:hypothetical protein